MPCSRTQKSSVKSHWSVKIGPVSFTPSVLYCGLESCQQQSSVLNNSTEKAYTSTLNWMRLHNGAGQGTRCHTPPQGTDNTTTVPSRISTTLFSNRAVVWGRSAGKESHIPEEGRKPEREGGLLGPRLRFPAGTRQHPRALQSGPDTGQVTYLLLYDTGKCLMNFFEKSNSSSDWCTNLGLKQYVSWKQKLPYKMCLSRSIYKSMLSNISQSGHWSSFRQGEFLQHDFMNFSFGNWLF